MISLSRTLICPFVRLMPPLIKRGEMTLKQEEETSLLIPHPRLVIAPQVLHVISHAVIISVPTVSPRLADDEPTLVTRRLACDAFSTRLDVALFKQR